MNENENFTCPVDGFPTVTQGGLCRDCDDAANRMPTPADPGIESWIEAELAWFDENMAALADGSWDKS